MSKPKTIKSKQRVRDYGEVYTPEQIVRDMLDLLPHDTQAIDSTYLEPACGNGAFLIEILRRKLERCKDIRDGLIAVSSVYGIDILPDNVEECKMRLYDLFASKFGESLLAALILEQNVICGNTMTGLRPDGSPIRFRSWLEDWREAAIMPAPGGGADG